MVRLAIGGDEGQPDLDLGAVGGRAVDGDVPPLLADDVVDDGQAQPGAQRPLGLEGLDGLIALYKDYRALTDELYARLGLAKLAIENSQRAWAAYCQRILRELLGDRPDADLTPRST